MLGDAGFVEDKPCAHLTHAEYTKLQDILDEVEVAFCGESEQVDELLDDCMKEAERAFGEDAEVWVMSDNDAEYRPAILTHLDGTIYEEQSLDEHCCQKYKHAALEKFLDVLKACPDYKPEERCTLREECEKLAEERFKNYITSVLVLVTEDDEFEARVDGVSQEGNTVLREGYSGTTMALALESLRDQLKK